MGQRILSGIICDVDTKATGSQFKDKVKSHGTSVESTKLSETCFSAAACTLKYLIKKLICICDHLILCTVGTLQTLSDGQLYSVK